MFCENIFYFIVDVCHGYKIRLYHQHSAVHENLQWKPFSTIQNKTFSCCISIFCLLFSWKLKYRDNLGQQDIRIKFFSISLHAAFTSVFIPLHCCIYIAYISEKKDFVIIQFTWIFIRLILTITFTDCPLRFHINTCWSS